MTPEQEEALIHHLDRLTRTIQRLAAVKPESAVILDQTMDGVADSFGFKLELRGEPARYRYERISKPTEG